MQFILAVSWNGAENRPSQVISRIKPWTAGPRPRRIKRSIQACNVLDEQFAMAMKIQDWKVYHVARQEKAGV